MLVSAKLLRFHGKSVAPRYEYYCTHPFLLDSRLKELHKDHVFMEFVMRSRAGVAVAELESGTNNSQGPSANSSCLSKRYSVDRVCLISTVARSKPPNSDVCPIQCWQQPPAMCLAADN